MPTASSDEWLAPEPTLRFRNPNQDEAIFMEARNHTRTERWAWWSARRLRYNVTLLIAAPISAVILLTVWWLFAERFPCLEITGVAVILWAILFLVAVGFANICYFLGPLSERLIRPRNALAFRRRTYGAGVAFSLLLIFSPPILNLLLAFLGPQECTDEFGERHVLGAVTASAQGCAAGWHRRSERRIQLDQDLIGLSLISSVIFLPPGADYSLARFWLM